MSLSAGLPLAHDTILGPLGAAVAGAINRAKGCLDREARIKVLAEHLADDTEQLKRFDWPNIPENQQPSIVISLNWAAGVARE